MERRFPPTAKRLRKARQEGNTPKSQYLTQAGVLVTVVSVLALFPGFTWVDGRLLLEYLFTEGLKDPGAAALLCGREALKVVSAVIGLGAFVGVVLEVSQIGLFFEPSLALPRLERIDVARGTYRVCSSLKQVPIVLLRFLSIVVVAFYFLYTFCSLVGESAGLSATRNAELAYWEFLKCGGAMFGMFALFAVLDVFQRRRQWTHSVGMTLEELKREQKEEEGDPHIRASRRARHRELSMQDMIRRVKSSKVIIVAPRKP